MRLWLAFAVAVSLAAVANAESDTMANYEVDPNRPCGMRCQIARAMQAWGGLIKVDGNKLLHKYRRMQADGRAATSLQRMNVDIEQRLGESERVATSEDSVRLKKMRARLRESHGHLTQRVARLLRAPAGRAATMKIGHAMDVEQVLMRKVEQLAASENSLRGDKKSNERLGEALAKVKRSLSPHASGEVAQRLRTLKQKQKGMAQRITQAVAKVMGAATDKPLVASIHAQMAPLQDGLTTLKRMSSSDQQIRDLKKEHSHLHQAIQSIVASNNKKAAVRLEMLKRADRTAGLSLGETALSGTVADGQHISSVKRQLSHMKDLLKEHSYASKHQANVDSIQERLSKVQGQLDASASADALSKSLQQLRATNDFHNDGPTLGESNSAHDAEKSASQLATDVDELLLAAHKRIITKQKKLIAHEVESRHLKHKLATLKQKSKDQGYDTAFLDAKLNDLKKQPVKGLHDNAWLRKSIGNETPSQLASDVDNVLKSSTEQIPEHGTSSLPPLDVADELIPVSFLEVQALEDDTVPFVSNKKAKREFNADHDPAFFNEKQRKEHKKKTHQKSTAQGESKDNSQRDRKGKE